MQAERGSSSELLLRWRVYVRVVLAAELAMPALIGVLVFATSASALAKAGSIITWASHPVLPNQTLAMVRVAVAACSL